MPPKHANDTSLTWRRSGRCVGESHCVELAVLNDDTVRLRNSTDPRTVLTFDADEWENFMHGLKSGELSLLER